MSVDLTEREKTRLVLWARRTLERERRSLKAEIARLETENADLWRALLADPDIRRRVEEDDCLTRDQKASILALVAAGEVSR